MKEIPLHNRNGDIVAIALVDDADYEWLMRWRWNYDPLGYARRTDYANGKRTIKMHAQLLGLSKGEFGDHINRNRLDNQRENLRRCTVGQNNANSSVRLHSSRFKGVSWHKQRRKWQANIRSNHKTIYLGIFDDETQAAHAYDQAARAYHGEFANTNF